MASKLGFHSFIHSFIHSLVDKLNSPKKHEISTKELTNLGLVLGQDKALPMLIYMIYLYSNANSSYYCLTEKATKMWEVH